MDFRMLMRTKRTRVRMLTLVLMDHIVVESHMSSYVHLVAQVAVEQGNSCGRDLKVAADRVSQSEQEVTMVVAIIIWWMMLMRMLMIAR